MINGNANDFLNEVYNLSEIIHWYHGKKYFFQGYGGTDSNTGYTVEVQLWEPEEKVLWSCTKSSLLECRKAYLEAPIYDGKTFWEAEKEIEWVDN